MKVLKSLLTFTLLLLSFQLQAGQYIGNFKVARIQVYTDGIYIVTDKPFNHSCNGSGKNYIWMYQGHSNFDAIYSLLLTAQATGKDVKIYSSGCASYYPYVANAFIYN